MRSISRSLNAIALIGGAVLALFLFASPYMAHAQTAAQDNLRATIRAEITADPRSQSLSQAQINSMVDALAVQAQKQGVTADQLTYRATVPTAQTSAPAPSQCTGGFLCSVGAAFGFLGGDATIPVALFIVCVLFILIFSIMREMGHPHAQLPKRPTN
jgi:hypothetical protein